MSLVEVLRRQRRWAAQQWPQHDSVCAPSIEANLFNALNAATWEEFAAANGNELGLGGKTPKISSLRSSSALACNVFDPWRGKSLGPLADSLGIAGSFAEIKFEQKLPHGLKSFPPNIDVVIYEQDGSAVGIESKFAEIYGNKKTHPPLDAKYFVGLAKRWTDLGLPSCQRVAEELGRSVAFRRIGAGQLLKHMLGLARLKKPVRLMYLWFDAGSAEAEEHRREVEQFHSLVRNDLNFFPMTYQHLFERIALQREPRPGYVEYLRARYFSSQASRDA
jgi:hypothetical protein